MTARPPLTFDLAAAVADANKLYFRGNCYPDNTDGDIRAAELAHAVAAAKVFPPYVPDLDAPRTADDLDLSFLMVCQGCGGEGPLFKEWSGERKLCAPCREHAEDRAQEHRSEEAYRREFTHRSAR